jgi:hypothetical protein
MVIEAHIGLLHDLGFDFYGGDYNGNIPKRLSPYLPKAHEIHKHMWDLIRGGDPSARQLDWSAVGIIYTQEQLAQFMSTFYKNDEATEIKQYVQELSPDKAYVLVAYETGEEYDD